MSKPSRFDYIKYDGISLRDQAEAKKAVELVERTIEMLMPIPCRAKENAFKALEECYMWIGKGIRDEQISRNVGAELQEERNNG